MEKSIQDNITVVNSDNEVIAVISEKEVIVKNGYKVLYDVGVNGSCT